MAILWELDSNICDLQPPPAQPETGLLADKALQTVMKELLPCSWNDG